MRPVARTRLPMVALAVGLAMLAAVGSLGYQHANALDETDQLLVHTHAVIESLDDLLASVNDAVAQRRAYALTGDASQQRVYAAAVSRARGDLATVSGLTEDNPRQQRRVAALRPLIDQRLTQLEGATRERRALGADAQREVALTREGNAQSAAIQLLVDEMEVDEHALLDVRQGDALQAGHLVRRTLVLGLLLSALVLVGAFFVLRREVLVRTALATENERLFGQARSHANDLREANEQMVYATIRAQELTEVAEAAAARVQASQRELSEAAEFRELFIGVLGHDLRNPLGSVLLAASAMSRHGRLDGDDTASLGRIVRGGQRMSRMVGQLLDFTRARLGSGFALAPEHLDLGEVCRQVIEEFEAAVQLDLEGDVSGTWDRDRLMEVLSNLVGNAVQHRRADTPVVIAAHGERAHVVVEVSNEGLEIPPELLPHIFDPFRQGRSDAHAASGNLGLGLYIASQIVAAHGGTLSVRSGHGRVTFSIRLPRQPGPATARALAVTAPPLLGH